MVKCHNYINASISILFSLLFFSACENQSSKETGFLEGVISIGPICPVEKDPPDPACLPTAETYKAYPVSIWTSNGRRKIGQINPALDGSYKVELEPGNYLVILETVQSRVGSSNLPAKVLIIPQDTVILNIDIDTGIR